MGPRNEYLEKFNRLTVIDSEVLAVAKFPAEINYIFIGDTIQTLRI